MNWFRSIKVRVWALFEVVVIAMLTFTYIFLIALFPNFYEWMKTHEITESMEIIEEHWTDSNIAYIINEQAARKKMYIEIYFPSVEYSYIANRIGGSMPLTVLEKKSLRDEVSSSETGVFVMNPRTTMLCLWAVTSAVRRTSRRLIYSSATIYSR